MYMYDVYWVMRNALSTHVVQAFFHTESKIAINRYPKCTCRTCSSYTCMNTKLETFLQTINANRSHGIVVNATCTCMQCRPLDSTLDANRRKGETLVLSLERRQLFQSQCLTLIHIPSQNDRQYTCLPRAGTCVSIVLIAQHVHAIKFTSSHVMSHVPHK